MKYLIPVLFAGWPALAADLTWQPATDCRANIAAITCRVNPMTEEERRFGGVTRQCQGGEAPYVAAIERVYDEMSPKVQKVFCHMRRIFVEEEFFATAYASQWPEIYEENGKKWIVSNGLVVGLSKAKLFDASYDISEWMNRKEQTMFGRQMTDELLPALVPQFNVVATGFASDFKLMDVFAHEIGHLLDFTNNLNQVDWMSCFGQDGSWKPGCVPPVKGAWASISWKETGEYRAEDSVFGGKPPCYYVCSPEKLLDINQAVALYQGFIDSNAWVSTYAANNPMDDWAETFAYSIFLNDLTRDVDLVLNFPDGRSESLKARKGKGHIQAKLDFARLFFTMEWKYDMPHEPRPMETDPANSRIPLVPMIPCH